MIKSIRSLFLLAAALAASLQAQPSYTGLRILPNPAHTTTGYIRFFENSATHYVGLKAPGTVAANISFTLPNALPGSTLCVFSDSSGILTTAPCVVQGSGCVSISGTTVSSSCPNITYTNGNAINIVGSVINANYGAGTGISISGSTISGAYTAGSGITITGASIASTHLTYTAGTGISISGSTISGAYTAGSGITITGASIASTHLTYSGGTCISISGSTITNTCGSSETSGNFGSTNITSTGTSSSLGGLGVTNGITAASANIGFAGLTVSGTTALSSTLSVSGTITASGGLLSQSNGIGALGFNPWNGSSYSSGQSHTYTMTDAAGTGTCTIIALGGAITGGTC